jgi:hypothetical protein
VWHAQRTRIEHINCGNIGAERALFDTLQKEEMAHIQTLGLVEPADDYDSKDISREARLLLRTLDAADRVINKAQFSAMDLEDALRSSLSLEEGVVENFAISLPSVGSIQGRDALDRMSIESTGHADMLRDALMRNGYMHQS